jgi:ATP-dependent DNA ligase
MPLPRVQPIAPTWRKEPFDDPDWLFEFKYDGFRALCYLEQRRNRLISRNNNVMARFDALADEVAAALNIDDAILDGEVIAADETGRPVFIDLLRGMRPFDILWLNGTDLRPLPLHERRLLVAGNSAEGIADRLQCAIRRWPSLRALRADVRERPRGRVAKRLADPYDPGARPNSRRPKWRSDTAPRRRCWIGASGSCARNAAATTSTPADRERTPRQTPPPVGVRDWIAGALDLGERGQQLG